MVRDLTIPMAARHLAVRAAERAGDDRGNATFVDVNIEGGTGSGGERHRRGRTNATFIAEPDAGTVMTISDPITEQTGFALDGAAQLFLANPDNRSSGTITINSGTLELGGAYSAGGYASAMASSASPPTAPSWPKVRRPRSSSAVCHWPGRAGLRRDRAWCAEHHAGVRQYGDRRRDHACRRLQSDRGDVGRPWRRAGYVARTQFTAPDATTLAGIVTEIGAGGSDAAGTPTTPSRWRRLRPRCRSAAPCRRWRSTPVRRSPWRGGGTTIDGGSVQSGFTVNAGTLALQNLSFANIASGGADVGTHRFRRGDPKQRHVRCRGLAIGAATPRTVVNGSLARVLGSSCRPARYWRWIPPAARLWLVPRSTIPRVTARRRRGQRHDRRRGHLAGRQRFLRRHHVDGLLDSSSDRTRRLGHHHPVTVRHAGDRERHRPGQHHRGLANGGTIDARRHRAGAGGRSPAIR